uniref:HTH CENPB-type domain-containing protein n=1 Tax=Ditylenchus dipsaci TaxID=166011 RepID=A0A915DBJ6_9BILA
MEAGCRKSRKVGLHPFGKQSIRQGDWVKKEGKLKSLKDSCRAGKTRKRLRGGGRPLQFKDLDKELAIWVRKQRGKKHRVSRRIIQQQAGKMFNAEEDDGLFMVYISFIF